ncbi:gamma-glutamylcyclotransferase [Microbacterium sp. LRZ72]|uniref:gamma-glutamylcyclotransferase family protein n=1 Tax=Microbacterium sp. LRZ72 TaxID=2942481 RepID=UPI0029B467FF|nr:gamma-glutamylcyclotransferase family protein [Microbacterium sp. LRZ72]MDX2375901.1 gamma-glutamylcyclotransferase [Microbacterium sp. LRZ72]
MADASGADVAVFTYASLREPTVQRETFGRVLDGVDDVLSGYTVDYLARPHDGGPDVPRTRHLLRRTGSPRDKVVGRVVHLTEDEVDAADEYEIVGYRRALVTLESGTRAWIYLAR